jgi:methylmalonyl-CoA mutase
MATRYDPWVNLLRGTVACFAAGVGGADVITVAPYDIARDGVAGDLGRRMARNTQSLLVDESGIGRVADPAGGSFFVERLTDEMAHAAWAWFQEIERAGGMVAALEAGLVQRRIEATWAARREAIAHRRDPITGVSEFPDIAEPVPPAPEVPAPAAATPFPPLADVRYAEPFESLRARADRRSKTTGERPAVFLATLGRAADHTARATFAANLFAAAGIRALDAGDLIPGEDAGAAFAASGARLACICSSDAVYAERAAEVARALAAAGAARVYLAGRAGDAETTLREAGVDEFAFVGCDALDLLSRALDAAGVGE